MLLLQDALEEAIAGRGSVVILTGEAGIGKTRIAMEFAQMARARGVVVLRCSGVEGEWQPPYGPWVEALGEYARTSDIQRLRSLLGPSSAPLALLVPQIAELLPTLATPAVLSPEAERLRLYDSVVQLLMAVAEDTPLLLIIDDLHWVDRDSLRLLRHTARLLNRARILMLGAYRQPGLELGDDHPLPEVLVALQHEAECRHLHVRGLDRAEVAEYLTRVAGKELPQAPVGAIYEATNGNPFYVRELFQHLMDEGKLDRSIPTGFNIRELGIPEVVRLVVDSRLSRLSRETESLLMLAAGFTGGFRLPEIRLLANLPDDSVIDCLDEALRTGFLQIVASTPPIYDFTHAIVRHALYGRLNPDRRARLHRLIALALEQEYSGREKEHATELAAQYYASVCLPDSVKGLPFALEAAEQARAAASHEKAVRFLRMAAEIASQGPASVRAQVLCQRAIVEAEALMLEEAPRSVKEALAALSEIGAGPRDQAEFLEAAARILKDGGATAAMWEPLVEQGIALLGDEHDLLWARLTLLRSCFEPGSCGEIVVPRWVGLDPEAVSIARAVGNEDDYARTLLSPDWRSREETAQVLTLARGWSSPTAVMRGLEVVAYDLTLWHGDFREAIGRLNELLEVAERYGALPVQAMALSQMAQALAILGEFELARQATQRAGQIHARLGSAHGLTLTQAGVAATFAFMLGGDWQQLAEGASKLARSSEVPEAPYPQQTRGLLHASIGAVAYYLAGDQVTARRLLNALTRAVEGMAPRTFGLSGLVATAAIVVWEMEAVEYAQAYRRMALDLMEAGVGMRAQGPHEFTVARMAALLGDMEEAREYFRRTRLVVEEKGMRPVGALVDYHEALALLRACSTGSRTILELLDSAETRFRELGMQLWLERTQTLRAQVASLGQPHAALAPIRLSDYQMRHAGSRETAEPLTRREREVAALVGRGLTNSEIAAKLVVSVRTAEAHVASILGKLGFNTRAQIAVWTVAEGISNSQGVRWTSTGEESCAEEARRVSQDD